MITRVWFAFDFRKDGWPEWKRSRFTHQKWLGLSGEITDEAEARETLEVIADRFRPGAKMRLVRITEEVVGPEVEPLERFR